MLIGTYEHTIDAKGRVFIPAKLRGDLGDKFVVSRGLADCLIIHPLDEWKAFAEKITSLPISQRGEVEHFWFSNATDVEPDAQGRIGIPQNLREFADLSGTVVIVGSYTRVEIWNPDRWNKASQSKSADEIAAIMEQLGM